MVVADLGTTVGLVYPFVHKGKFYHSVSRQGIWVGWYGFVFNIL